MKFGEKNIPESNMTAGLIDQRSFIFRKKMFTGPELNELEQQ